MAEKIGNVMMNLLLYGRERDLERVRQAAVRVGRRHVPGRDHLGISFSFWISYPPWWVWGVPFRRRQFNGIPTLATLACPGMPDDRRDVQVCGDLLLWLRTTAACMHPSAERLTEEEGDSEPLRRTRTRPRRALTTHGVASK